MISTVISSKLLKHLHSRQKINCIWQKVGGSKAWRALDFKTWGGSSL